MVEKSSSRVDFVDAIRGFSILGFILLHNMQHYSYHASPAYFPGWLQSLDLTIYTFFDFLFGSRSYLIFSMLFGFGFYVQNKNQQKKGKDFRLRFLWRMLLLLGFSFLNSIFYTGDILALYFLMSFILIITINWSSKQLMVLATILLLQPFLWADLILNCWNPTLSLIPKDLANSYIPSILEYLNKDSFRELAIGNLTIAKPFNLLWSWETGRFFQTAALFLIGVVAGKENLFLNTPQNKAFWKKSFLIAIVGMIAFLVLKNNINIFSLNYRQALKLEAIYNSGLNLSVAVALGVSFYFGFYFGSQKIQNTLQKLIPIGKMSLTIYLMNSLLGSLMYYNYGLGLFHHTGGTFCLFIAVTLFLLQLQFCKWWLKTHNQGPVEAFWHKLTWIYTTK